MVVTTVDVHGPDLIKLKQKDDEEQRKPDKNIKLPHKGKNIDKFITT